MRRIVVAGHETMCVALGVSTQAEVARALGVGRQDYHRGWFTGPTSLAKIALWVNAAGLVLEVRDGEAHVVPTSAPVPDGR